MADDPFFQPENETIEEKRLKDTKNLIQQLGQEQNLKEKEDFFLNLQAEVNILEDGDDKVKKALKYKVLEQRDKLFYNLNKDYGTAANYERVFMKGHKKAITQI